MSKTRHFFSGFSEGFGDFGRVVSATFNYIILSIVYFLGVGATVLAARLKRKHFLEIEPPVKPSYFMESDVKRKEKDSYYRQF